MKNKLLLYFSIIITIIGGYYSISKIKLDFFIENISLINFKFLLLGFLIVFFRNFIAVFRWRFILKIKKIQIKYITLFEYYLMSSFFNLILPTSIGGDIFRGVWGRNSKNYNKYDYLSSIFIERLIGLFSLFFLALIASLTFIGDMNNSKLIYYIFISTILYILSFTLLFNQKIMFFIFKKLKLNKFKLITKNYEIIHSYNKYKIQIFIILIISLIYQLVGVLSIYVISLSININLNIIYYFIFIPIIWILTILPISLSGFGVRESSHIYFFSSVGVYAEKALLLSFLSYLIILIIGIIGGLLYLYKKLLSHQGASDDTL